jgi:hypothetical protein
MAAGDVGLRQSAPQQAGNLERVELVVLGLPAVNRFHRQRVPEHEGDLLGGTHIGEPVPGEHAFGRDDQILSVWPDDLEESSGGGLDVPMYQYLPRRVEDADVLGLHVEIDAAIVTMLTVVESHSLASCAGRICPASAYGYSVGAQGEG